MIYTDHLVLESVVFWGFAPCGVAVGYQRLEGPCCLHLQG